MPYTAAEARFSAMQYRRCGDSGILLPVLSLGFWQNFGAEAPYERVREMARRAFDLGITHFDLANNYGPPPGSAEESLGRPSSRTTSRPTATNWSSPPRRVTRCGRAPTETMVRASTS